MMGFLEAVKLDQSPKLLSMSIEQKYIVFNNTRHTTFMVIFSVTQKSSTFWQSLEVCGKAKISWCLGSNCLSGIGGLSPRPWSFVHCPAPGFVADNCALELARTIASQLAL